MEWNTSTHRDTQTLATSSGHPSPVSTQYVPVAVAQKLAAYLSPCALTPAIDQQLAQEGCIFPTCTSLVSRLLFWLFSIYCQKYWTNFSPYLLSFFTIVARKKGDPHSLHSIQDSDQDHVHSCFFSLTHVPFAFWALLRRTVSLRQSLFELSHIHLHFH